ncbi:MAG: glycosyltransferase, partial [Chloroflexi bacterium]|nr:glycosyltransferase [Chloroflexota bacterium]
NLSNDSTLEIIREQQTIPFGGTLQYLSLPFQGKVGALNAGIHRVNGEIIFNLDADTVLHVNAILEIAREFQADPKLAAATGAIEITSVEDQGLHPIKYAMAEAEYLEYFTGFNIGRQYQSETGSLFTLAGAFSAFRRDILHRTFLYDQRTVSEDTSLTLHSHPIPGDDGALRVYRRRLRGSRAFSQRAVRPAGPLATRPDRSRFPLPDAGAPPVQAARDISPEVSADRSYARFPEGCLDVPAADHVVHRLPVEPRGQRHDHDVLHLHVRRCHVHGRRLHPGGRGQP